MQTSAELSVGRLSCRLLAKRRSSSAQQVGTQSERRIIPACRLRSAEAALILRCFALFVPELCFRAPPFFFEPSSISLTLRASALMKTKRSAGRERLLRLM